jgi:phosphohistidine swiveling domain-containing protein
MTNRTIHMTPRGFPSPFDIPIPPGCEGWEELYAPHSRFSERRRAFEEGRFWFQDAVHYAEPYYPFDAVLPEFLLVGFSQASARLFVVPPSLGLECRILNGYVYLSGNSVTNQAMIARRAKLFERRGGYYYDHWKELDAQWRDKVETEIHELEALEVPKLPEVEDESLVREGRGYGSAHRLLVAYDRLLEGLDRICHYHFELVNLGYGAYLVFYEVCRQAFPDISDQTIAKMVAGLDLVALRPDDELRRLAQQAVELGLGGQVKGADGEKALRAALTGSEPGERWLGDFEQTKHPWFNFSYGNGLYHHHRSWIDDPTLPIAMIGSYIERLEAGEEIARPREQVVAERDRITDEHHAFLPEESRVGFDEQLALARTVFPHIENHNFYIEQWYHTVFWNKVREFGALLARHGFLADQEDIFFLRHDEVRSALDELRFFWSSGGAGVALGPLHWPEIVERRKTIHAAMRVWAPPPALGLAPEEITEPVTIMHWGITTERVQEWLESSAGAAPNTLRGVAGSPGVVEGVARLILDVDQLNDVEAGEVLVAPFTSTSWTPVFGRIAAAVTDAGGVMCHAAIVAREYGLPAVLGTGTATKRIRTGDRLRVDGGGGLVTILQEVGDGVRYKTAAAD